jgi:hypothetical protein
MRASHYLIRRGQLGAGVGDLFVAHAVVMVAVVARSPPIGCGVELYTASARLCARKGSRGEISVVAGAGGEGGKVRECEDERERERDCVCRNRMTNSILVGQEMREYVKIESPFTALGKWHHVVFYFTHPQRIRRSCRADKPQIVWRHGLGMGICGCRLYLDACHDAGEVLIGTARSKRGGPDRAEAAHLA